jgi:hypothetical protein
MKKRHTLASKSLFLLSPGRGATSGLSSINFKRLRDPLGPHKNDVFVGIVLSRQQLDFYHGPGNLQRIFGVFVRSLDVLEP